METKDARDGKESATGSMFSFLSFSLVHRARSESCNREFRDVNARSLGKGERERERAATGAPGKKKEGNDSTRGLFCPCRPFFFRDSYIFCAPPVSTSLCVCVTLCIYISRNDSFCRDEFALRARCCCCCSFFFLPRWVAD